MLKSILCDFSDAYKFGTMSGLITVVGVGAEDTAITADWNNKQAVFKSFALFTDCITEINNTQVDNIKNLDVVLPICNLVK